MKNIKFLTKMLLFLLLTAHTVYALDYTITEACNGNNGSIELHFPDIIPDDYYDLIWIRLNDDGTEVVIATGLNHTDFYMTGLARGSYKLLISFANDPFPCEGVHLFIVGCSEGLYMQDCSLDEGEERNSVCNMGTWDNIWNSPDLWNCWVNADYTGICIKEDLQAPREALTNHLWYRVRNNGTTTYTDAHLKLYWTMASTGEIWPWNWENGGDYWGVYPDCMGQGSGGIIPNGSNIALPILAPGDVEENFITWAPPNYTTPGVGVYTDPEPCGVTPENPDDLEEKYEICLLARIESASDPMTYDPNFSSTADLSTKT